jgi:uncharacterized protein
MGRILFFILLAIVVYVVLRSMQRRGDDRSRGPSGSLQPQAMVSCAKCGLHVPRHEALPLGDRYFCCEEHRRNASSV